MSVPCLDVIHFPGPPPSANIKSRTLLFFVTGNPGLIEYYRTYLSLIHELLAPEHGAARVFDIYGSNLIGFDTGDPHATVRRRRELGVKHEPPYSLEEVIDAVENDLHRITANLRHGGEELDVIIMGHSVGAYIGLELIQRHRRRLESGVKEAHISGGVCLFPTVVDIGKSERGKVLTALSRVPFFPILISLLCSSLCFIIPTSLLNTITARVTNHTAGPTTTAFLKSPHGVRQALFMGADEMRQITTDKWDDELWGAAHPSSHGVPRPKLFFLFGQNDHWVADRTRDDLMKLRGERDGEDWRPVMAVDDHGVPHGFCISHNRPVAERTAQFVRDIVKFRRVS